MDPMVAAPDALPMFVQYTDEPGSFERAMSSVDSIEPVRRSSAYNAAIRQYQNIDTYTSVRDGFTRQDYEYFRPSEASPKNLRDAIAASMDAYYNPSFGLIRNIID